MTSTTKPPKLYVCYCCHERKPWAAFRFRLEPKMRGRHAYCLECREKMEAAGRKYFPQEHKSSGRISEGKP